MMNFEQAYNYLLSFNNFPRHEYMKNSKQCSWYLQRLNFFLDLIDHPEKKIPNYIHVTGTSGKGSTVSFLHNLLRVNNYKVGSTYSPHPTYITQRWKINDRYMTKKEFVEIVNYLKPFFDKYINTTPYDMLSFFEITELIGFVFFAKHKIDWVVLEVACGGRYDSSNIIPHKKIAVITNIGLDHVGIIGNNKQEIAYEKAGIIKKNCLTFTQEKNPKILKIIKTEADKQQSTLFPIKPKYKITKQTLNYTEFIYNQQKYRLQSLGEHQIKNAILSLEIAKKLKLKNIYQGLKKTKQPLRFEIINKQPLIILDGAHNQDKIKTTVQTILNHPILKTKKVNLLLGLSKNKAIKKIWSELKKMNFKYIYLTRNTSNAFRLVADPKELFKLVNKDIPKNKIKLFVNPDLAFQELQKKTSQNDLLLVTGSIFLSGQFRL